MTLYQGVGFPVQIGPNGLLTIRQDKTLIADSFFQIFWNRTT